MAAQVTAQAAARTAIARRADQTRRDWLRPIERLPGPIPWDGMMPPNAVRRSARPSDDPATTCKFDANGRELRLGSNRGPMCKHS